MNPRAPRWMLLLVVVAAIGGIALGVWFFERLAGG